LPQNPASAARLPAALCRVIEHLGVLARKNKISAT
jgi:hypothetical protein